MANITLVAPVRLASESGLGTITGIAGEAIDPEGASEIACYVAADGLIYKSVAIAAGVGAQFDGMCTVKTAAGSPVRLFQQGYKIYVGAHGLAIGAFVFTSVNAGLLADATAGVLPEEPIGKALSSTVIEITRMDRPNINNT